MSSRYKWFSIGVPGGFSSLAPALRNAPLLEQASSGFSILTETPQRIEGEFLSKVDLRITRSYLGGEPVYENVATISSCLFCIFLQDGKFWMRIADPPRSSRAIADALERVI